MKRWKVSGLPRERYHEMMRAADLSLGVYRIEKGAADTQKPHTEDEVYFVLAGRARFTSGGETVTVAPGDVLFVPARERHRFHDVEEDLALLVVFAPAEGSRAPPVSG
jgi:mannose-6-phosphate isomerase-like protein (cupin superfamily)